MERDQKRESDKEYSAGPEERAANEPRANDTADADIGNEDKEMSEMSKEFDEIAYSSSTDNSEQKPAVDQKSPQESAPEQPSKTSNFNKYFLYTLVGGLIISALISVFAVLAGEFNSTMARALGTTVSMVAHTLILLFLISLNKDGKNKTGELLINTLLIIVVASFITSIFAIWKIFTGQLIGDLYQLYFNSFCAVLWSQLMLNIGSNLLDKPTRIWSLASIGLTALLYFQLLPTIFIESSSALPEFYYRTVAAVAILLATSSVLTIVFHRIYMFKHPEIKQTGSRSPTWNLIVACIFLFFISPIVFMFIAMLSSLGSSTDTRTDSSYQPRTSPSPYMSTQPKTTPGTSSYDHDSDARSDALNKQYNLAKQCIEVSEQNISDSNIEVFDSINTASRTLITKSPVYSQGSTTYRPYYPQTVFVDKNCKVIETTSLKPGDKLYYYHSYEANSIPEYKLRYVQKIN